MTNERYEEIMRRLLLDYKAKGEPRKHPLRRVEAGCSFWIDLQPWWKRIFRPKEPSLFQSVARVAEIEIGEARDFLEEAKKRDIETGDEVLAKMKRGLRPR